MSSLSVPLSATSPSLSIPSPSFTKNSRSTDANTAYPSSSNDSPTIRAGRSVFKATQDAFEEANRHSLRREIIAKEYSKALDEVTTRMREAKMSDDIEVLTSAFAHVLRMFALGDQALDLFHEFKKTRNVQKPEFRQSLSIPQSTRSHVSRNTFNLSKRASIMIQSPTPKIVENVISVQSPNTRPPDAQVSSSTGLSPLDVIQDDFVNDKPYCIGWSKVSSQYRCSQRRGCQCATTGECFRDVFYNYLIDDSMLQDDFSLLKKHCVIEVSGSNAETIFAEEIRLSMRNLGTAYAYYVKNIANPTGQTTLLSISTHIYKSVCFTAECVVLAVNKDRAQDYGVVINTQIPGQPMVVWVLCMRQDVIDAIIKGVINIGRDPVISMANISRISYKDDASVTQTIIANSNNVYGRSPRPLFDRSHGIVMRDVLTATTPGILAVGTARATLTVSLIPSPRKSGARNQNSRVLEYLIHAIS